MSKISDIKDSILSVKRAKEKYPSLPFVLLLNQNNTLAIWLLTKNKYFRKTLRRRKNIHMLDNFWLLLEEFGIELDDEQKKIVLDGFLLIVEKR